MNATILLVEDNPRIMEINAETLTKRGYRVLEAKTIEQGRVLFDREKPDLIILDIMLPDGDGLSFCKELRGNSKVPILFLSALRHNDEMIAGLLAGGDDYLPKPHDINMLAARVETLLRRAMYVPDNITKGNLTMLISSSEVYINNEKIRLPQNEFSLLLTFMQNENRICSDDYLYDKVWGQAMADDNRAVQNTVSRLRKSIAQAEYDVITIRGQGYVLRRKEKKFRQGV